MAPPVRFPPMSQHDMKPRSREVTDHGNAAWGRLMLDAALAATA